MRCRDCGPLPEEVARALRRLRATTLARRGEHRQAAEEAARLRELAPANAQQLVNVAQVLSLCSRAADTAASADGDRPTLDLSREYQEKAVDALLAAWRIAPALLSGSGFDPDFSAVRHHPRLLQAVDVK